MRYLKVANILGLTTLLIATSMPVKADSPDRTPTYSSEGGSATAEELAAAMDVPADLIITVALDTSDPVGTHVFPVPSDSCGFPTSGNSFAAISSGSAQNALLPNDSESLSTVLSGLNHSQGDDLVQLTLTLKVPPEAKYWAVDWRFLSEEYPEWVGTSFNDAFLIETPSSTFTISGNTITAPDNAAVDPSGKLVTINTTGAVGMSDTHATGTTYDGSTETLTTVAPIPYGATNITLVFSVMDLGDSIYDTTVFLDNFRFVSMAEIPLWQEVLDIVLEGLVQAKKNLGETGVATLDAAGPWLNLLTVMIVIGTCLAPEPTSKFACAGAIGKAIVGQSITLVVRAVLQWWAEDPPDPNFTEVATLEPVEPIEPGCDVPLIIAWAEFLTKINEQQAIAAALMTSGERLQGAIIAEEPEFTSLQAQAVAQFSDLLTTNQVELVTCMTALQSIYSSEIGSIEGDLRAILEQVISDGFTLEQYGTLIDAGLTDEEIGWLRDLFNNAPSDSQGFDDWVSYIEESMVPGLIGMSSQMNTVVETLEQVTNPPTSNIAPEFDVPPSPPAGTEFTIAVNDTLTLTIQASDPDVGDEVNLELMEAPLGTTINVSQVGSVSTGTFSWTPAIDQTGVHILTFVATDNHGLPATPYQIVVVVFGVTSYDLPLASGLNLISLPLIPESTSIEEVLAGVEVDWVAAWDAATQTWLYYWPGLPLVSDFAEMTHGVGYCVSVSNPCTLIVSGTVPGLPQDIPLFAGSNLIGLPLMPEPQGIADIVSGCEVGWVAAWDAATQTWLYYWPGLPLVSDFAEVTHGVGYWFGVANPCTLNAQVPKLPHSFYGTLKIGVDDAPIGTEVEARGEGVTVTEGNPIITTEEGQYGGPGASYLVVQGDIEEGTTLRFYVDGVFTGQTFPYASGEITELNLSLTEEEEEVE